MKAFLLARVNAYRTIYACQEFAVALSSAWASHNHNQICILDATENGKCKSKKDEERNIRGVNEKRG